MLSSDFFNQDAEQLAKQLLGKVIYYRHQSAWLSVMIVETEAYYLDDKSSHASLGFTEKRKALFMPAGTIYMYYARGADSMNISARGEGNAVLVKAGLPYMKEADAEHMLAMMQALNPPKSGQGVRPCGRLCAGQTLLCRSLGVRVNEWDQKQFCKNQFYIDDVGYVPEKIIQAKRLGIPKGRDEHLLYRFIDHHYAAHCTENPLRKKSWRLGHDYRVLTM